MSGQLESQHFFRVGDVVRADDGRIGRIVESFALYAVVAWEGAPDEEVDQFDPRILVVERAWQP